MKEFLDVRERKWDRDVVDSTKIAQGMVDPAPCFCFLFFFPNLWLLVCMSRKSLTQFAPVEFRHNSKRLP